VRFHSLLSVALTALDLLCSPRKRALTNNYGFEEAVESSNPIASVPLDARKPRRYFGNRRASTLWLGISGSRPFLKGNQIYGRPVSAKSPPSEKK